MKLSKNQVTGKFNITERGVILKSFDTFEEMMSNSGIPTCDGPNDWDWQEPDTNRDYVEGESDDDQTTEETEDCLDLLILL